MMLAKMLFVALLIAVSVDSTSVSIRHQAASSRLPRDPLNTKATLRAQAKTVQEAAGTQQVSAVLTEPTDIYVHEQVATASVESGDLEAYSAGLQPVCKVAVPTRS